MRIAVLALDDVFDIGLSAVLDTLGTANHLAAAGAVTAAGAGAAAGAQIAVRMVGVRRRVRTHQGMLVPVEDAGAGRRPDVVIVPALGAKTPDTITAALGRRDVGEAGALVARWAAAGTLVAAACTGTFVVAEAGLLDGQRATTTWWLAALFRKRYPRVDLEDSRMLVEGRGVVTAGAALSHVDLALWIVRRTSPDLAALAARYLVVEPRASQGVFAIPDQLAHEDPVVTRFERWSREHLADFSLGAAARAAGASERTLTRRTRAVLGKSPLSYVRDLRVEQAVHLLQTTGASVEEIAAAVGYSDGVTLRTLLRKKAGHGVREIRRQVS